MARAHFVKKARKDIKGYDGKIVVAKGESYYWWQFRNSPKQVSKTMPRRSQLTRSDFYATMYDIEDAFAELNPESPNELRSFVEDQIAELQNVADECRDKQSNMPDSLQYSPTGELLEARAEAVDNIVSDLESITLDGEPGTDNAEALKEWMKDKIDEVQNVSFDYE
jgi:hypothetical protein